MDLLVKIAILFVVIAVAAALLFLFSYSATRSSPITENAAISMVISDLQQKVPGANITVINATSSSLYKSSWSIYVELVKGSFSPCPYIKTIQYDYPAMGLVNVTSAVYTAYVSNTCFVYAEFMNDTGSPSEGLITLPEIAIAVPLNRSYAPLVSYINANSYNKTFAHAVKVYNASLQNSNGYYWLINYSSANSNVILQLTLSSNGTILRSSNISST